MLGYGTDAFPGFYLADSGYPVPWRVDTPEEAAAAMRARAELGATRAIVVANPLPSRAARPGAARRACSPRRSRAAAREGVARPDVTPFLLDCFHRETGGASLEANVRIVLRNAELAARIAGGDVSRVVVVGDLMVDVVAALPGAARARQRHARADRAAPGRRGANVAAWLAAAGVPRLRVAGARATTRSATPRSRRCARRRARGASATPSARPAPASCSSSPAASAR